MRKTLIKFALLIAGIFSFCSCQVDKEGTYTFYYSLKYAVEKEETVEPLKKYFTDRIDFDETYQYTGTQSETMALANEKFIADAQANLVHEEVLELLGENDIVVLDLNMLIKKGTVAVSQIAWYHTDEEESDAPVESSINE